MGFTWSAESNTPPLGPRSVVVSSFPSAGLAATVAGHYIVRSLNLERTGFVQGPEPAPIAVIQGGKVHPPVRVYGGANFAIVLSEFPAPLGDASAIATAIMAGAEERQARMIVCFEGVVPHPAADEEGVGAPEGDSNESVWAVTARGSPEISRILAFAKARPLEDGVIGGVTGALLVLGLTHPIPVVALLVSARSTEGFPDHRAGAVLIETLDRMLPELTIDTGPLRTQAELIEKALRQAMKNRPKSEAGTSPPMLDNPIYQ